jgi:hypothetical protein
LSERNELFYADGINLSVASTAKISSSINNSIYCGGVSSDSFASVLSGKSLQEALVLDPQPLLFSFSSEKTPKLLIEATQEGRYLVELAKVESVNKSKGRRIKLKRYLSYDIEVLGLREQPSPTPVQVIPPASVTPNPTVLPPTYAANISFDYKADCRANELANGCSDRATNYAAYANSRSCCVI